MFGWIDNMKSRCLDGLVTSKADIWMNLWRDVDRVPNHILDCVTLECKCSAQHRSWIWENRQIVHKFPKVQQATCLLTFLRGNPAKGGRSELFWCSRSICKSNSLWSRWFQHKNDRSLDYKFMSLFFVSNTFKFFALIFSLPPNMPPRGTRSCRPINRYEGEEEHSTSSRSWRKKPSISIGSSSSAGKPHAIQKIWFKKMMKKVCMFSLL